MFISEWKGRKGGSRGERGDGNKTRRLSDSKLAFSSVIYWLIYFKARDLVQTGGGHSQGVC